MSGQLANHEADQFEHLLMSGGSGSSGPLNPAQGTAESASSSRKSSRSKKSTHGNQGALLQHHFCGTCVTDTVIVRHNPPECVFIDTQIKANYQQF